MKKTLLALAVAAVATSASAATVYSNEGTQVGVGGYFDVVLGNYGKGQRTDLRNNESRINFTAQQDLGDGFKALGYARLRFDDFKKGVFEDSNAATNTFGNPVTNKLWLALEKEGVGRVSFGRQDTTGDAVQLNDNAYFLGGNNNLLTSGKKAVSFRSADFQIAEGHTLGFGADYVFGEAKKHQQAPALKNGYGVSAFYGADFGGVTLNVNAGYTVEKYDNAYTNNQGANPKKSWRLATQLGLGDAKFGVEYGQSHAKNLADTAKSRHLLVAAEYQVLPVSKVFAQWQRNATNKGLTGTYAKELQNIYIVGADYEFSKNVVSYVQFAQERKTEGTTNGSTKTKDNRYGVGLRVYF
ncbi:porin [Avibacterium paragallinarum]|uniref:OmpH family outer membrane protein n=1 Tax=Avibacterium paragallinarum TaxID=728 RepID=A0A377I9J7_AVIPA|nr:porin [Avibacterium paragallinarum]POY46342.1 porin [Avibacterium paragallinarum]CDF99611.1 Putative Outer membrane protein, ompH family [Avibacterium paragallinarum JF4211]STO71994.1 ompH family outer membrane protein [Avibacterium paragallinarum]